MRDIIVDTDWLTDVDDVVAMRVVSRMHQLGRINLIGVVIDACMEESVSSLNAFLHAEGLGEIPIGLDVEATDYGRIEGDTDKLYQYNMAKRFHTMTNADSEPGVALYRKLLAASKNGVDILSIGHTQVLSALLQSKADIYSPLDGADLVKQKVNKLWMMAGNWEKETGLEYNFERNARSRRAGHIVCKHWPTELTFLGFEVGDSVLTGDGIDKDDILYQALVDFGSQNGRSSWDPMLCLLGCIGDEGTAGYDVVRGQAAVDVISGENSFVRAAHGKHRYVVKKFEDQYYRDTIQQLL